MATLTAKKIKGGPTVDSVVRDSLEINLAWVEEEQWEFIRDEVEKMKEAQENAQKEEQRLREEQEMIEKQWTMIEVESKQRLREQREKTQDSILRAKKGLKELQNKTALFVGLPPQTSEQEDELKASEMLGKSSNG